MKAHSLNTFFLMAQYDCFVVFALFPLDVLESFSFQTFLNSGNSPDERAGPARYRDEVTFPHKSPVPAASRESRDNVQAIPSDQRVSAQEHSSLRAFARYWTNTNPTLHAVASPRTTFHIDRFTRKTDTRPEAGRTQSPFRATVGRHATRAGRGPANVPDAWTRVETSENDRRK